MPTLDGKVTLKVPAGTGSGRVLRARGKGITKRDGSAGDLLITLEVAVPNNLSSEARKALEAYADVTTDHDPRGELNALLEGR